MKDMMFESALALDTLLENCQSVPWLAKTSVESIHDAGHTQIARVNYALGQLRQMNVVDDKRRNTVSLLGYIFKRFAGAVAEYKEQIVAGNITLLGDVNAISKPALKELMKTAGEWREQLELLSSLVAWLATAPEPSFDTSDSQTPPDNDTHSTADTEVVK